MGVIKKSFSKSAFISLSPSEGTIFCEAKTISEIIQSFLISVYPFMILKTISVPFPCSEGTTSKLFKINPYWNIEIIIFSYLQSSQSMAAAIKYKIFTPAVSSNCTLAATTTTTTTTR